MCGLSVNISEASKLSSAVFQEMVAITDGKPVRDIDLCVAGGGICITFGGWNFEEGATAVGNEITDRLGFDCEAEPGVE